MNLKRYTEINGREALERLANGLSIFDQYGQEFGIDFDVQDYFFKNSDVEDDSVIYGKELLDIHKLNLTDLLNRTWHVKKPFDVRAEVLERPNEWVAAFKDHSGKWHKVGFDLENMTVTKTTHLKSVTTKPNYNIQSKAHKPELDRCIPIEDVPVEELA